jgi:hypothetical protein
MDPIGAWDDLPRSPTRDAQKHNGIQVHVGTFNTVAEAEALIRKI